MLQQKINAARRMAKIWTKIRRLKTETSRQVAEILHTETVKLQLNPEYPQTQATCKNLKEQLIELQHRKQMDLKQRVHVD